MTTCPYHGEDYRPGRCHECARLDPERKSGKIQLRPEDAGKLVRTTEHGRVVFRVREGETLNPAPRRDWW